jgi:23S rRNA pseudouridine2605 synthase
MRINKYIAQATGMSRRAADTVIEQGRVLLDGLSPSAGAQVTTDSQVTLDGRAITPPVNSTTIMLHKPAGYVTSRDGQGSPTIYELLPDEYLRLKPVGRLDKDSSGLLLLTDDGDLANQLTHPRYSKEKVYLVRLDRPLTENERTAIRQGIPLEDGLSAFEIDPADSLKPESHTRHTRDTSNSQAYAVRLREGRNRQIRRTFAALDYCVTQLHRIAFGDYQLSLLPEGQYQVAEEKKV